MVVGYRRMLPPTTAATITVHLFLCAASCLSVSQLSAKPLHAEENAHAMKHANVLVKKCIVYNLYVLVLSSSAVAWKLLRLFELLNVNVWLVLVATWH